MVYTCQPVSRRSLREYAYRIRQTLKLENTLYFPVVQFLEVLPMAIGDDEFYPAVVADDEWELGPSVHACYDLEDNCIYIAESVYEGACDGCGRDRMTIAHECAHVLLLKHSHLSLRRSFDDNIRAYEDPEWQAKCLAGELLIPKHLVTGMSADIVAEKCGVSELAANYQLGKYKKG